MENDTIATQVTETIQDTSALATMTDGIKKLTTTPVSEWLPDLVKEYLVPFGLKLVAAIVVLLLGRWVIKLIKKWMANGLMSRHGDATLHSFLSNLVSVVLYFFLIMAIVGILGINTSSLVALLASAGLAVGMSLGGTTGYAMNPARDLSPRCAHAILPIAGKRDSGWGYSWVPVAGPMTGAALAALLYLLVF